MSKKKAFYTSDEIKMGNTAHPYVEVKYLKLEDVEAYKGIRNESDTIQVVGQKTIKKIKKLSKEKPKPIELKHLASKNMIVTIAQIVRPDNKQVLYRELYIGNENLIELTNKLNSYNQSYYSDFSSEQKKFCGKGHVNRGE